MKDLNPTLTIVTPTYNRGVLLKRCYESLKNQTCFDFEWVVVDDGSSDNTKEVLSEICNENNAFHIKTVYKENGGKHTALNASHPYVHGKYVLILDSDDMLTGDAVETVIDGWNNYENDSSVAMVTFIKKNTNGQLCAYAEKEYVPTDVLRNKRICVTSSDCCEVIRAKLYKKYVFPVFDNERFVAETALWYRAGLDGSCIYINKVIYICEYLADGLSGSGKKMRFHNPQGGMYTSYLRMNKRCYMKERIRAALLYVGYGHFAHKSPAFLLKQSKPYTFLVSVCYVPGTILYLFWNKKYY